MKSLQINRPKISTVLMIVMVTLLIFSRKAKVWLIAGMMMIGFFKPEIPDLNSNQKLNPAPAMEIVGINGHTISLQKLKGKVVFVNFWATWCPPCLAELPSINSLYQKLKNDTNVVFLAIDVDNDLSKSSRFLHDKGYTIPVFGGDDVHVPPSLYANGIPTTLVINKNGEIVFSHFNRANYNGEKFEQFISALAKQ